MDSMYKRINRKLKLQYKFDNLLICIMMKRRNDRYRDRDRDRNHNRNPIESHIEEGKVEKPLLNFSSCDVSAVSSQQSSITGKPSGDKICKNSSAAIGCNLSAESDTRNSSKVETQSSDNVSGDNDSLLLPFPPGISAPPPATVTPPPSPPPNPLAPGAPPPPKMARPPPNPPKHSRLGPHHRRRNSSIDESPKAPKAKLKPFFWDKVQANPDHSMVWHNIKGGSFQFNEEMMQMLFGYAAPTDKGNNDNKKNSPNSQSQPVQIRIIDSKKAQNLAILLKALNVTTEEVCDALKEGNELPLELIETLLKMAPTTDEELKLRLFSGDISQLGPAERFLKVIVDIPFAFKRFESLLFMCSLHEEVSSVSESFTTLEIACKELRNSRLFLKLLEAVLKTGNRMNDGTFRGGAQAFKLETLLKLSDVKGTDGKTTLLHFVVQEIIRSEGVRTARRLSETTMSSEDDHETEEYHSKLGLEVVSELTHELENVKKAAVLDGDIITGTVLKLGNSFTKTKDFLKKELMNVEDAGEFTNKLGDFLDKAEIDIIKLKEEDKRIMDLVKKTGDYFHGKAGKDEGLRLFTIVRDFLIILDKVCREVRSSIKWCPPKITVKKESVSDSSSAQESVSDSSSAQESVSNSAQESVSTSAQESVSDSAHESHNDPLNDTPTKLFPTIKEPRSDSSDSDSDSDSDPDLDSDSDSDSDNECS